MSTPATVFMIVLGAIVASHLLRKAYSAGYYSGLSEGYDIGWDAAVDEAGKIKQLRDEEQFAGDVETWLGERQ